MYQKNSFGIFFELYVTNIFVFYLMRINVSKGTTLIIQGLFSSDHLRACQLIPLGSAFINI